MIYAQFYQKGVFSKQNIQACGTDGVFVLDGRNRLNTMLFDVAEQAKKLANVHKFSGFKLFKGESFNRSIPVDNKFYELTYERRVAHVVRVKL